MSEIIAANIDHDQDCNRCGGKATEIIAGSSQYRYLCKSCLDQVTKPSWVQIYEEWMKTH